jgi:hypothetical protein
MYDDKNLKRGIFGGLKRERDKKPKMNQNFLDKKRL